jgi:hypothetical protein
MTAGKRLGLHTRDERVRCPADSTDFKLEKVAPV